MHLNSMVSQARSASHTQENAFSPVACLGHSLSLPPRERASQGFWGVFFLSKTMKKCQRENPESRTATVVRRRILKAQLRGPPALDGETPAGCVLFSLALKPRNAQGYVGSKRFLWRPRPGAATALTDVAVAKTVSAQTKRRQAPMQSGPALAWRMLPIKLFYSKNLEGDVSSLRQISGLSSLLPQASAACLAKNGFRRRKELGLDRSLHSCKLCLKVIHLSFGF